MLPLSVLHANDDLEVPDKHAGVYIIHETHPGGEKSTALSHPVSPQVMWSIMVLPFENEFFSNLTKVF